jgi:hypothetical protein
VVKVLYSLRVTCHIFIARFLSQENKKEEKRREEKRREDKIKYNCWPSLSKDK